MKKLFYILLILLFAVPVAGENFYVDGGGSGAGTVGDPWSATQFNDTGNWGAGAGKISGGDFVYFSGTISTRLTVLSDVGSAGNIVTLDGYAAGDCDPINDCDEGDFTCDGNTNSSAILSSGMTIGNDSTAAGPDYITVQDFRMTHSSNVNVLNIIPDRDNGTEDYAYSDYITVQRNFVYEAPGAAFGMYNSRNSLVYDNKFFVFAQSATPPRMTVIQGVSDTIIRGNEIGHDEVAYPHDGVPYTDSPEMLEIHKSNHVLIEYNDIYGNYDQSGIRPKEQAPGNSYIIIRFNKIYDNGDGGTDSAGIHFNATSDSASSYFYIYGNFIYDNHHAGIYMSSYANHVYIWGNLFISNDRHGIGIIGSTVNNIYMYNNTFARNNDLEDSDTNRGGITLHAGSSLYMQNNILWNNRPAGTGSKYNQIYSENDVTISALDYNTWFHGSSSNLFYYDSAVKTLANMVSDTAFCDNGTEEDSGFTNPDGTDTTYGTDDDDYTLDGTNINDGADLSECFYPVIQGTTYTICYEDGLGADTDWTGLADTLEVNVGDKVVKRGSGGLGYDRGAYVYGSSGAETDNPTPDPATWSVNPVGDSTTTISMTATTGADVTPPISYSFDFDPDADNCNGAGLCGGTVGTGGSDSGWQSADTTFTDDTLQLNKCYCYSVQMKDSLGNTGTASAAEKAVTWAATPGASTLGNAAETTLDITEVDENSNTAGTWMAIQCTSSVPHDDDWVNMWVNETTGAPLTPLDNDGWQAFETWDAEETVTGLNAGTEYCFKAKAINSNSVETALGAEICLSTTGTPVPPPDVSAIGVGLSGVKFD